MANLVDKISLKLLKHGDKDNNHLLALPNVWLNYSPCNVNLYLENYKPFVITENGYKYSISELTKLEQFSILYNIEIYVGNIKKMLNEEFNKDVDY